MRPCMMSRSSLTINNIWKARGRRPTLRRTCKVFIPRDLRQLDTLRVPASYEEDHIIVQKLKTITRHKLHHWILVAAISCYIYSGAILFQYLEAHYGRIIPFNMSHPRDAFLRVLAEDSRTLLGNKQKWLQNARQSLLAYETKLLEAGKLGYKKDVESGQRPQWSTSEAIVFCFTVITTVGYGNIAPSTNPGRAVTILYAFLGIPLMLMVLADLGKLFTKAIKFVFRYVRRFYKWGTLSKAKAATLNGSNKPLQYMTVSWRTVSREPNSGCEAKKDTASTCNQVTTLTLHNDDLYKDLDFMNADETNHKHVEVEDEFNLPVSLAIALVLIYMVVGALLFAIWEEWSFFEAFYFVFISMSTVGFGDFVPSNQTYMMGAFAYLVFGLTLTSMCINVIQEKLSATFQKAKVRIGNTIGLDVNTLLSDEDQKSRCPKSEQTLLRNVKNHGSKTHLCRDSVFTRPATPVLERSPTPVSASETPNEVFLNAPLQKRFTFYDSPYSTIQNDNLYTVTSVSSLTNSRF